MPALHCNQCYRLKDLEPSTLELSMAACGHVFCRECASRVSCKICRRPFIKIANEAGSKKIMCEDPIRQYRHFQQTARFQITQQAHLFNYFVTAIPGQRLKLQQQRAGLERLGQRLAIAEANEKARIDKLRAYLRYFQRHPERMFEPRRRSSEDTRENVKSSSSTLSELPNITLSSVSSGTLPSVSFRQSPRSAGLAGRNPQPLTSKPRRKTISFTCPYEL